MYCTRVNSWFLCGSCSLWKNDRKLSSSYCVLSLEVLHKIDKLKQALTVERFSSLSSLLLIAFTLAPFQ